MLNLKELIRRTRSKLDDTSSTFDLWTREDILGYINDTVRDAAIRASLTVQDDVSIPFAQNADLTWKSKYALPSGYLDVRSVRLASSPTNTLVRTSIRRQEQIRQGRPTMNGGPTAYALDQTQAGTGDDRGLYVRTITFLGTPTGADTALLDVVRLPRLLEYDDDVPEIDEIYHPDLIFGITALAYLKHDDDTYDPKKAVRDMQLFEDRFGTRIPASVMRERQTDVPLEMILS